MKRNKKTRTELLSATAIARRLKRSPQGVLDAITRLGVSPELVLPSGSYFSSDVIQLIEKGMRRRNGANKEG